MRQCDQQRTADRREHGVGGQVLAEVTETVNQNRDQTKAQTVSGRANGNRAGPNARGIAGPDHQTEHRQGQDPDRARLGQGLDLFVLGVCRERHRVAPVEHGIHHLVCPQTGAEGGEFLPRLDALLDHLPAALVCGQVVERGHPVVDLIEADPEHADEGAQGDQHDDPAASAKRLARGQDDGRHRRGDQHAHHPAASQ